MLPPPYEHRQSASVAFPARLAPAFVKTGSPTNLLRQHVALATNSSRLSSKTPTSGV